MALFRVVSDLHLDCCMMDPRPDIGAEVAIVAGDVLNGTHALSIPKLLHELFPESTILFVPGNHEGYRLKDYDHMVEAVSQECSGTRVKVLARGMHEMKDGAMVLGATLWTDFKVFGKRHLDEAKAAAAFCMMDYREVRLDGVVITPEDTLAWHKRDRAWIEESARALKGRRMAMVTHHAPRRESLAPKYAQDLSSGGFVSDLPTTVLEPFALWVHGHTHTGFDYKVGQTRVICNPRGYTKNPELSDENPSFKPDLLVEI